MVRITESKYQITINDKVYLEEYIQKRLIPYINVHYDDNCIFWLDKANVHYTKVTVEYLEQEGIHLDAKEEVLPTSWRPNVLRTFGLC